MNPLPILKDSVYFYSDRKLGSRSIRQINIAVTYKCNSRCKTCDIWKWYIDDPKLSKEELSTEEIKNLFSQLGKLRTVGITGGEPFLRNDLFEIAKSIQAPSISITTNSMMPIKVYNDTKKILELKHIKKLSVNVSIDGIGEIHDKIRGIPGNYETCMKTLSHLKNLQKDNKKLSISISNTISSVNVDDILNVYNLAKKMNVVFSTRMAQSSDMFYKNISSKLFVKEDQLPKVRKIFEFLLKEQPHNLFYRYYLTKFLENPSKQPVPCYSGFNSYFIDPYGYLFPCIMLNKKIGNIRKNTVKELLASEESNKIRKHIAEGKCSCWTDCEALSTIYSNPMELAKAYFYSL